MVTQQNTQAKFERTLALLRDPDASFTAEAVYSLSDLSGNRLADFMAIWPDLALERRCNLASTSIRSRRRISIWTSAIVQRAG